MWIIELARGFRTWKDNREAKLIENVEKEALGLVSVEPETIRAASNAVGEVKELADKLSNSPGFYFSGIQISDKLNEQLPSLEKLINELNVD